MTPRLHLRMPGRVYERLNARAQRHLDQDSDVDLCEALSEPKIRRRGAGWSVYVPLEREQVRRLAAWISDRDPAFMRQYRDAMREAAR
jgi:hypothetical protein